MRPMFDMFLSLEEIISPFRLLLTRRHSVDQVAALVCLLVRRSRDDAVMSRLKIKMKAIFGVRSFSST